MSWHSLNFMEPVAWRLLTWECQCRAQRSRMSTGLSALKGFLITTSLPPVSSLGAPWTGSSALGRGQEALCLGQGNRNACKGSVLRPLVDSGTSESSRMRGMPVSWFEKLPPVILTPLDLLFDLISSSSKAKSDYSKVIRKLIMKSFVISVHNLTDLTFKSSPQIRESLRPITFPIQERCENNSNARKIPGWQKLFIWCQSVWPSECSAWERSVGWEL